jgi:ADP-ribose pyrophosphatase YjhB (NUDIX family)
MHKVNLVKQQEHILDEVKYCIKCGSKVSYILPPDGDIYKRFVCNNCQHIHYQNPKIVIGTISIFENKILLCKRGIQPRYGYWTLPAGFMENGETTIEGAKRETFEEANASSNISQLFSIINVQKIGQVHLFYLANFDGVHIAGSESLETQLFNLEEIPWNFLAFPSIHATLKSYIEYVNANVNSFTLPIHHEVGDYKE